MSDNYFILVLDSEAALLDEPSPVRSYQGSLQGKQHISKMRVSFSVKLVPRIPWWSRRAILPINVSRTVNNRPAVFLESPSWRANDF